MQIFGFLVTIPKIAVSPRLFQTAFLILFFRRGGGGSFLPPIAFLFAIQILSKSQTNFPAIWIGGSLKKIFVRIFCRILFIQTLHTTTAGHDAVMTHISHPFAPDRPDPFCIVIFCSMAFAFQNFNELLLLLLLFFYFFRRTI